MKNATTLDITDARNQLSSLANRLKDEQVIWVTKHNKKAFAVVSPELMEATLETLEILADPNALKMLQESLDDIRAGRLVDHKEIRKALR